MRSFETLFQPWFVAPRTLKAARQTEQRLSVPFLYRAPRAEAKAVRQLASHREQLHERECGQRAAGHA